METRFSIYNSRNVVDRVLGTYSPKERVLKAISLPVAHIMNFKLVRPPPSLETYLRSSLRPPVNFGFIFLSPSSPGCSPQQQEPESANLHYHVNCQKNRGMIAGV
ncbi:hypothetical protein GEV33_009620 [Tenebrio molitor]|uniref:Uncharacterized protein n=1 Tax=Tenebrio molitor TaxID=7067 RepID=A0A8J6LH59_TENMO|nr:hypothetical protein GEV33_009620 [Tenebrio molitor]